VTITGWVHQTNGGPTLDKKQQDTLADIIVNDFIPYQKAINFCNDKRLVDKFKVTDKSAPGIYVMSPEEAVCNSGKRGRSYQCVD
jgi:hypothetical protein